ncbi:MAG: primosomal protein N' [Clostridia bacterium]|nr:primosomal protein N' [Clostridia bacterium]
MRIAEVIVDISNSQVDKIFDYQIEDWGKIGMRVFVPFGNRIIQGFIINIKDTTSYDISKLKKIIKPIDEYEVVLPELIELMKFMIHKYHLRLVDCLRLFIPAEMRSEKVKPLIVTNVVINKEMDKNEYAKTIRKNAKNQLELFNDLQDDVVYSKTMLSDKYSRIAVNKFIQDGLLIEQIQELSRKPNFNRIENKKHKHTELQIRAINTIKQSNDTFLLFGVTGSGKTEVYMSIIEDVINKGKTAIMLVPEISLTPQVLGSFKARFGEEVAILHSGLSAGERFDEWRRILFNQAKIVVGARSAIFAPLTNVGVIIVDEEHETSYISETNPRYNAFDIAKFRKDYNNCPLVLASATPSINSFNSALNGEYKLIELPERVNGKPMPKIQIVDMLNEIRNGNTTMFSTALLYELDKCMQEKHQAMIFINRRGFSSFMRCTDCGYVAKCTDCDVTLVYHKNDEKLKCHYCGKRFKALTMCPECGSKSIKNGAVGTEQVVEYLQNLYPNVEILRMDNDTTRTKDSYQKILNKFSQVKPAILVGTQMIAKGHDFSDVTVVGIVDADQSLYHSDFRSTEKTFELITQMSGRAGRAEAEGKVILQTYAPRHYAYRYIANYDYKSFFDKELNLRKTTKFPPFTKIIRILFSGDIEEIVRETTKMCYNDIKQLRFDNINEFVYLDVMKSPIGKIKNKIRYQILARITKSISDELIQQMYSICDKYQNPKVSVFVEIDPQNLS